MLKLLRIFSRKEMRDKLNKEFGYLLKQQSQKNEIEQFNEQFAQLHDIFHEKLSTPLEEVQSMQE